MKLSLETERILADLEERIDPIAEDDFLKQWDEFLSRRFSGNYFVPERKHTSPSPVGLPQININDAVNDYERMLVSQLVLNAGVLEGRSGCLGVRANYGTGILSSLFGAEIFTMPYEMNTLPTTRAFAGEDDIERLLDSGMPSLDAGFGRKVFEMGEFFAETFARYPKIRKYIPVYHPDLQGPLDICELMWGGGMFYAMYDDPEQVHRLLRLVTDTYTAFLDKWYRLYPPADEKSTHWNRLCYRGRILLRSDSAMNLSPELYAEFAYPYDAELLRHFGGGAMHFCGRGDHYIEKLCTLPELTAINLSQPHLNDMEKIYRNTVDKGILLVDFSRDRATADAGRPGGFHGYLHCMD
ncbi:MAG: hypothetical protein ACI4GO_04085 [Hominenteromicrobium sp.]